LQEGVASERSALAVAITIICLRIYGVATSALEQIAVDLSAQADSKNLLGVAMMLYALIDVTQQETFKV
jgi:hypothetical protein